MPDNASAAVSAVLEPGEQLVWAGEPDREVMLKTLGKRKRGLFVPVVAAIIIGGFLWANREMLGNLQFTGVAVSPTQLSPLLAAAAVVALIFYLRKRQATGHVDTLAYGITDRRVLIVRKGEIYESITPDRMRWVELEPRLGAEGYYDIIWDRRKISGSSDSTPSPLELERARVGFKALRDGPVVMERLQQWRTGHSEAADDLAQQSLDALQSESDQPRLEHPRLGFSLPTPAGWEVSVRNKKLVWGKTGIDMTAEKWLDPATTDDWNVIRLRNVDGNSQVLLEVAESEPVATFESMADPNVPGFVKKVMQVVDSDEHVELQGLQGFRVDTELSGMGETQMAMGQSSDLVQSTMRQYVFHDGIYQYYLMATWPRDNEIQQATCQAIVDRVHWCPTFTA